MRRPTQSARRTDTAREDALRSQLADDPNNEAAFRALAEIVRRRAVESANSTDPLVAPVDASERQRAADLAVWALGEELAGNPRAWYPLVEVARLSVGDDHEGTLRRLTTAAERDPSGKALADGLQLLRSAGLPAEALNLGVGHWRPRDHDPEIARQLVLAALEAGRPLEARQHLATFAHYRDEHRFEALRTELESAIDDADRRAPEL